MTKTCWIIGASHGIGEALAKNYFAQGFNLAISARSLERLEQIKEQLLLSTKEGREIFVNKVDVVEVNSLIKARDKIIKNFGQIDLVIFCSALYQPTSALDFNLMSAKQVIDVNFNGFLNLLYVITPQMLKQKCGQIAVIASVAGYCGLPQSFVYGASKAALINLCEGIYPEMQKQGIAISVINPGFVKTRLTNKNSFKMPFIISPESAADMIVTDLEKKKFEIHFPKRFTFFLKILRFLPYSIFFFVTKKIV